MHTEFLMLNLSCASATLLTGDAGHIRIAVACCYGQCGLRCCKGSTSTPYGQLDPRKSWSRSVPDVFALVKTMPSPLVRLVRGS